MANFDVWDKREIRDLFLLYMVKVTNQLQFKNIYKGHWYINYWVSRAEINKFLGYSDARMLGCLDAGMLGCLDAEYSLVIIKILAHRINFATVASRIWFGCLGGSWGFVSRDTGILQCECAHCLWTWLI